MSANRSEICRRLSKCGLRKIADAYREEVRIRLAREAGGQKRDRVAVTVAAWEDMWNQFRPAVEKRERELIAEAPNSEPVAPQLAGLPPISDDLLDPDYSERDPGRQLRDSLLWAAMEWMRIIRDTDDGPVVDLAAASTPPPTPFALFVLSAYALGNVDKRRELISRALAFATKSHESEPEPPAAGDDSPPPGGFLDDIE